LPNLPNLLNMKQTKKIEIKTYIGISILFLISIAFLLFCGLTFSGKIFIAVPTCTIIYWFILGFQGISIYRKNVRFMFLMFLTRVVLVCVSFFLYMALVFSFLFLLVLKNIDLYNQYGYILPILGIVEFVYLVTSILSSLYVFELYKEYKQHQSLAREGVYVIRNPYGSIYWKQDLAIFA